MGKGNKKTKPTINISIKDETKLLIAKATVLTAKAGILQVIFNFILELMKLIISLVK